MTKRDHCMNRSVRYIVRFLSLSLAAVSLAACTSDSTEPKLSHGDIALNNRGVALMGHFDYAAAQETFAELVASKADWYDARTNLAIALMNRQEADDEQLALQQLAIVLVAKPADARANYVAGLLRLYQGKVEAAAIHFEADGCCKLTVGNNPDANDNRARGKRTAVVKAHKMAATLLMLDSLNRRIGYYSRA